jgi:hypothetical protein
VNRPYLYRNLVGENKKPADAVRISGTITSELVQDLMKPAQNVPLTRSPRGNDGDDGDGADSSAWVEDKKQGATVSSEAARLSASESTYRDVPGAILRKPVTNEGPDFADKEIFCANDVSD